MTTFVFLSQCSADEERMNDDEEEVLPGAALFVTQNNGLNATQRNRRNCFCIDAPPFICDAVDWISAK